MNEPKGTPMTATAPNPLQVAERATATAPVEVSAATPKSPGEPGYDEWRSCRSKDPFPTVAAAAAQARLLMATTATVPLTAYPCAYCPGAHLTKKFKGRRVVADVAEALITDDEATAFAALEASPRQAAYGRKVSARRRNRDQQRWAYRSKVKREHERDDRIDALPVPTVASADEIDRFFARHAPASPVDTLTRSVALDTCPHTCAA